MVSPDNMLLFLLYTYVTIRNFHICGGILYQKEVLNCYLKPVGFVEVVLFHNFEEIVLKFFYEEFPIHFCGFNPQVLVNTSKSDMQLNVLKFCYLFPPYMHNYF